MEPKKVYITQGEITLRRNAMMERAGLPVDGAGLKFWGVPRGGMIALRFMFGTFEEASCPENADVIVDDIVDSGDTRERYFEQCPEVYFLALVDKTGEDANLKNAWVVFPWEVNEDGTEENVEDNVMRLLQHLGENPKREGLAETPKRFVKAMLELTSGLREDPAEHLKKKFSVADADPEVGSYDQIILSKDLPFVSLCEHHLLPFDGLAHIAYIPEEGGHIVGLSKLARCLEGYAKRPQVQERLTMQIANAMEKILSPAGVAVVIKARHTCQCFRGVKKDGRMVTSALRGAFRNAEARQELFDLISL